MRRKKILIVEDEIIESTSMSLTLTQAGYNCSVVDSGEVAIETVHEFEPDLILMDIGLGGKIDGISTAGIIGRNYTKPIVFITEQTNNYIFQQAMGAGPQNYINKPYTDVVLVQAVALALSQPTVHRVVERTGPFGERVEDGIFVYHGNEYKKVLFKNILCLEASGVYTIMHCSDGVSYKISLSSNNVVAQLSYPPILRTSRSFYVNIHRIESIRNDELIVEKKHIPISKNFKAELLSRVRKLSQK